MTSTTEEPVKTLETRAVTRDVFSATLGSVCCCYVGQPFDTVKVRMQTNPDVFRGVFSTVTNIAKTEGISAFWKGAVPTAAGMAAENAMAFGVNAALQRAFPDPQTVPGGMPSLGRPFVMGALTGCCSALVLLPSEIVKAKLQVVVGANVTAQEIMRRMMRKQGTVSSFFIGLDAQLARDASFYAVFFGGYEVSCYLFRTYVPSMPEELNFFISGGLAGMLGWTCAMPFDVPKTVSYSFICAVSRLSFDESSFDLYPCALLYLFCRMCKPVTRLKYWAVLCRNSCALRGNAALLASTMVWDRRWYGPFRPMPRSSWV
jgi:solute carrier family 25 (mitochondrial ornithine transporter) member 2/15